jgi:pteridine reductase
MTQNRSTLTDQTALVTGAAQRIGAAIATELHNQGMDILLHYWRSKSAAEDLKHQLEQQRPNSVWLLQADLNDTQGLQNLITQAGNINQRLDLLVNNASSFYPTVVEKATEAEWDDLIGSNLKAPFFLSQAAAPLLCKQSGSIINLVDIHALRPLKAHPIYSIAKAGNAMLVKALARELGPQIRVNGIAPGAILWPQHGLSENDRQTIVERTALKRPGNEEDIVRTLVFLHRDAPYITGQVIPVDGGRTLQQ